MKNVACIKLLITLTALSLFCSGCALFTQKFHCNPSDVESITIVALSEGADEKGNFVFREDLVYEVEDTSAFITELNNIECHINGGDPVSMEPDSIAIKITYKNGDRDLLTHDAQRLYRQDTGYDSEGFWRFDKASFEALITQYITDADLQ